MIDPELRAAFLTTDYIIDDDPPLVMHIGEQHDGLKLLLLSFGVETGAFLTAWNPAGEPADLDQNYDRQAELLAEIEALRLNYFVGRGQHPETGWVEDSYLVLGIERDAATALAARFGQAGYLWLPPSAVPELVDVAAEGAN